MSIKVIETVYRGYRFRSRTEAKHARLFDLLKIDWDYEPEGFELPDGRYMPDFFIRMNESHTRFPNMGYWVEIKGPKPTAEEIERLQLVCEGTGHHGILLHGIPGKNAPIHINNTRPKSHLTSARERAIWSAIERLADKAMEGYTAIDYLYQSRLSHCWPESPLLSFEAFKKAVISARNHRFGRIA